MSFIEIDEIVKRYGSRISVDHLKLHVEEGEIFGLLGPNGAGKSTTIKILCGLLPYELGDVRIDGLSVRKHPIQVKRLIGLVPQDIAVYDQVSAARNVRFFAKLYGLRGALLEERIEEALRFVGLWDRRADKPSTFSGGMKRRLNIACAIAHRPKLIIMDEPTVGIDPQSRNHILDAVKELNRMGSTIIYTSHYMEEVEAVCSRIGIMDHGRMIACGTNAELKQAVAGEEKLVIEADGVNEEALQELNGYTGLRSAEMNDSVLEVYMDTVQGHLQDILFILAKHQVNIRSLTREQANLESLFLQLTGRTLRD